MTRALEATAREEKDLEDPEFLRFVKGRFPGGKVVPDDEDWDPDAIARTDEEAAHQYRLAQARKLMRMYAGWKASLN
jgi:hypothetical protein